jgi:hypothetical protein
VVEVEALGLHHPHLLPVEVRLVMVAAVVALILEQVLVLKALLYLLILW